MTARNLDPRLIAALGAAKLTSLGIRRLGRGGGTAAPGLVADAIDPRLLTKIAQRLPQGAIVVAGTNGKTTTTRMLSTMLEAGGQRVLHNRSGSNLLRGVVAAFAEQAGWSGKPHADIAVIEADEAAFPAIVNLAQPRVILLNNLFRDQLDRYGELNAIAQKWLPTLQALSPDTTLVVNVDDPTLAAISEASPARRVSFGLDQHRYLLDALPHSADATTCRHCGSELIYDALFLSHLGAWRCAACGNVRPALDVAGREVHLDGAESLTMSVEPRDGAAMPVAVGVPGLYNAYNVVAAVTAAREAGVPAAVIAPALAEFRAAFGRIERVTLNGRTLTLALVKNPVGFNEVLRMLTMTTGELAQPALIAINDLTADGRDVSWLWDVDFELLADGETPIATTGLRGADMANRLKYAGVSPDRLTPYGPNLKDALESFVATLPEGGSAYVLPTYTAMLDIRQILSDLGAAETFWRQ